MYGMGEKYKIHSGKKKRLACLKSNQGYASFFLPELSEYYLFFNLLKDKRDEL